MTGDDKNDNASPQGGRWRLIRDVTVFQFKLFADGLRDLIFSPVSLVLALIDLVTGGDRFYNLLLLGRRTDVWINLFGKYRGNRGMDEALGRVETLISEQYRKGGVTASAKNAVDSALDKMSGKKPDQS